MQPEYVHSVQRLRKGEYVIPPSCCLTKQCRDLMSQIFKVEPSQRITIARVRQHPWFLKNLPYEFQVGCRSFWMLFSRPAIFPFVCSRSCEPSEYATGVISMYIKLCPRLILRGEIPNVARVWSRMARQLHSAGCSEVSNACLMCSPSSARHESSLTLP